MTSISSMKSLILDLPPSCIAFCPTRPQYFVVGTYYLHPRDQKLASAPVEAEVSQNIRKNSQTNALESEQQNQKRTGRLILFRLDGETITKLATTETDSAILDIQWTPHSQQHGDVLAVATSTGSIAFYRLNIDAGDGNLLLLGEKLVADPAILVLSIAWHPYRSNAVGFTLSNGAVSLCESSEGSIWDENTVLRINDVHHHELEAWTLAFAGNEPTKVVSGGDDIVLQCSTMDSLENSSLLWKDRKTHQAGITAILPLTPDLVLTGSYDDHIRLIRIGSTRKRQVLAEKNLSGGVWRLKIISKEDLPVEESIQHGKSVSEFVSCVILASCMHAGSRILRLCKGEEDGGWVFDVIAKFEEHESMNYGSDVQPTNKNLKSVVSISFYDKLLCLWQFDTNSIGEGKGTA